jgi:hypothetical protein
MAETGLGRVGASPAAPSSVHQPSTATSPRLTSPLPSPDPAFSRYFSRSQGVPPRSTYICCRTGRITRAISWVQARIDATPAFACSLESRAFASSRQTPPALLTGPRRLHPDHGHQQAQTHRKHRPFRNLRAFLTRCARPATPVARQNGLSGTLRPNVPGLVDANNGALAISHTQGLCWL